MGKTVVIALGGNALGTNFSEQNAAIQKTSKSIVDLVEQGHRVILSHGNGPQVGLIHDAMDEFNHTHAQPPIPLPVCVAMSQGYIGYNLQSAIGAELRNRGIRKPIATVLTQVKVDPSDPAFQHPTKPIGPYLSKEEAEQLACDKGYTIVSDSGRGQRRAVASPIPLEIVEVETIRALLDAGQMVIASGGGGIPIIMDGYRIQGVEAVVDKDLATACLAKELNADWLIILTTVQKVALHYGKAEQRWLDKITAAEARRYIQEGHFAPGSMLPKVQAAVDFAESVPGRVALITQLQEVGNGILSKAGTRITC